MIKNLSISALLLLITPYSMAIVDITQTHEKNEQPSLSADFDFSSEFKSGNADKRSFTFKTSVIDTKENGHNIAIYKQSYEQTNDSRTENEKFIHLRYVRNLLPEHQYELYTQLQSNEFISLKSRALLGGGLRYQLIQQKSHFLHFGYGAYYTWETYQNDFLKSKDNYVRGNFYLAYKNSIREGVTFKNTLYLQPRYDNASDLYAYNILKLDFRLSDNLHFYTSLTHSYDSHPFENSKENDVRAENGITYHLR